MITIEKLEYLAEHGLKGCGTCRFYTNTECTDYIDVNSILEEFLDLKKKQERAKKIKEIKPTKRSIQNF